MPTTSTQISRSKMLYPDLGHDAGAGLHAKVQTMLETLGDNDVSRIKAFVGVADSSVNEIDHNFGSNLENIWVFIYTGSGASKVRVLDPVASGYVIAEKSGSEKTHIEITAPGAGGPHTFTALVVDGHLVPAEIHQLIAAAPGTPSASGLLATWFDSNGRGLTKNSLGSIGTQQTLTPVHVSTSTFNALPGFHYICDTTSTAITATLPATIQSYDVIQFSDAKKTFGTNNLTIARNGNSIDSAALDLVLTTAGDGALLVGHAAATNWVRASAGGAGGGETAFAISLVSDPNATLRGGYLRLQDGRELATYDGAGSASTDFGSNLVVNLDTILGGNPANATTYYLYIDLNTLSAPVTQTDTGRVVYAVVLANFILSTVTPAEIDSDRYIDVDFVRSATSGTVWSGAGSAYGSTATRQGVRSTPDLLPENFSVNPLFERSITQGVTATTVTAAAETASPLVGKQSLKLTSQASTGTVQLAIKAIPAGYLGKLPLNYSAMMLTDASDANGDWTVGIYNTTDSVYTVAATSLVGGGTMNTVAMSWVPQSGKTYEARIARTISTASRVLLVDKQRVSNDPLPRGAIDTNLGDWTSLLALSTTWGTVTNKQVKAYREGGFLRVKGDFKVGTPAGTANFLELPTGYNIDAAQLHTVSDTRVGWYQRKENTANAIYASNGGGAIYYDVSDANTLRVELANNIDSGQTGTYTNGNSLTNSGDWIEFEFRVPIVGWSESGYIVTPSQVPRSTNVVDNTILGFAQTGAGTTRAVDLAYGQAHVDARGQYFVDLYLRTASNVGTDTGTNYVTSTMTATGANSSDLQPMRFVTTGTVAQESAVAYVSNNGGLRISSEISSSSYAECSWAGRVYLASKPSWFDANLIPGGSVAVQEATVLDMGLRAIPSATLFCEGAAGHGSTNTKIRRFPAPAVNTLGNDATFNQSATLGDSITINKTGVYAIHYVDSRSAGGSEQGISVNSNQLTTNISSITQAHRAAVLASNPFQGSVLSPCLPLVAGDVVRAHTDGTPDETTAIRSSFRITRIF